MTRIGMLVVITTVLFMGLPALPHGDPLSAQTVQAPDVASLIESLKDDEWQIRWYAAQTLGDMKDPATVPPLITTLENDENSYVRAMAAWALGEIKDRRAIEPLIGALKDQSSGVRKRAALALVALTGEDFGKEPEKWENWWRATKTSTE